MGGRPPGLLRYDPNINADQAGQELAHDYVLVVPGRGTARFLGHSQIRARYQVNASFGPRPVFPDLMGFGPVTPERTVDWTLQIDVAGHAAAQRASASIRACPQR